MPPIALNDRGAPSRKRRRHDHLDSNFFISKVIKYDVVVSDPSIAPTADLKQPLEEQRRDIEHVMECKQLAVKHDLS